MTDRKIDYFTFNGAMTLRHRIEAYWAKRGLNVTGRVVCVEGPKDTRPVYVVRSNLIFDSLGYPKVAPRDISRLL